MMIVEEHAPLRDLNTFGIPAFTRYLVTIRTMDDLEELIHHPILHNHRYLILGGGSNILFTKDFDGLVIKSDLKGIEVQEQSDDRVTVRAYSGENWHRLVLHCIDHSWGGIENLSLIPGTVGAAPIQNIGAYGVEVRQVIHSVEGIDLSTGSHRLLTLEECQFGYRDSVFKHALSKIFFISSITLRLTRKNHRLDTTYGAIREVLERKKISSPTLRDISDAVIEIRQSKLPDPAVIGNAGSFFKNPTVAGEVADSIRKEYPKIPTYPADHQQIKIPAGWLIEQCGWKGKTFGQVGVHPHQALVLVNYGNGTGEEILSLSKQIQESVKEKFGIMLLSEVNII